MNFRTMTSDQETMVFDFSSFMKSKNMIEDRQLTDKQLKAFIRGISCGAVNDFQLCAWLCSFAKRPFTLSECLTIIINNLNL